MATLLVLLLTACAWPGAGVAEPGARPCLLVAENSSPRPPSTPTDAPVITVDDRVGFWIRNLNTAPLGLAVYADGTVIRAEGDGSHTEPLTPMVIGKIDPCRVREAIDALIGLAGLDFGIPQFTDLTTTTVTVTRQGTGMVVLSAYGLGSSDDILDRAQVAARGNLTAAIEAVDRATSDERPWAPNRLQLTRFEREVAGPTLRWPLADSLSDVLQQRTDGELPCGVVDGADADTMAATLNGQPALSFWVDGGDRVTLAVGVLVPGQPGCAA